MVDWKDFGASGVPGGGPGLPNVGGSPGSPRMSHSLKRNFDILVSGRLEGILENLKCLGCGRNLPNVGVSPGSPRMSNSLTRNCNILITGLLDAMLEHLERLGVVYVYKSVM